MAKKLPPKPWTVAPSGPGECIVVDARGRKLFYIMGDQGDEGAGVDDEDKIEPSILFWGEEAESDALLAEVEQLLTKE